MNIYLLEQDVECGYDTYDSAVVIAENEKEARNIHPASNLDYFKKLGWDYRDYPSWVNKKDINKIKVTLLGKATEGSKKGVVCASFNAG